MMACFRAFRAFVLALVVVVACAASTATAALRDDWIGEEQAIAIVLKQPAIQIEMRRIKARHLRPAYIWKLDDIVRTGYYFDKHQYVYAIYVSVGFFDEVDAYRHVMLYKAIVCPVCGNVYACFFV